MNRDSAQIAFYLGIKHPETPARPVKRILFDSRQFNGSEGQIFFALKGRHHDGHDYLDELYSRGVRVFVVQDLPQASHPDAIFLQVHDSLQALQSLGRKIREEINPELYAITGSNGKTIVKEWLYQITSEHSIAFRSPKSYNSQIGVPLSLWSMPSETQLGIFEAGISMPDEMPLLQDILKPKGGIFTNIGSAHGENFDNQEQKIKEKLQLFREADFVVCPADDPLLMDQIRLFAQGKNLEIYDWSFEKSQARAWLEIKSRQADQCNFSFHTEKETLRCSIPFGDEASIQNAANALYLALLIGVPVEMIEQKLKVLSPVEMRLEMKEGQRDTLLINDAYNSDLESLRVALHFLDEHSRDRDKVLVLSDLIQSGLEPQALSLAVSEIIANHNLDAVYAIGPNLMRHHLDLASSVLYFNNTEEFLVDLHQFDWQSKAILLKGSRSFAFERIDKVFAQQRHETVMEIHLNRLVHNLNYYRGRLKPDTKLMVMVKAFAYGAGSEEIARVLAFHGVDYLAVAYADEGVALRRVGISLPIMVLNPESAAIDSFFDFDLEPEIYNFKRLEEFVRMSRERETQLKIHLKIETGMNRLGFTENDIPRLLQILQEQAQLQVASAFSHLAASDDPLQGDFTLLQIDRFRRISRLIQSQLDYPILLHIANTGAIEAYPDAYFDMVRLGIGLYGIASHPEEQAQLLPVAELKATISQIRPIEAGETVGYGRTWQADTKDRIAVISIGYADGFSRSLSNGRGAVLIRGKRYPIIGRVCMDMCMIAIGEDPLEEGDEVLVFGADLPVQEMAEAMNTIPYEVLTGISPRVKRVYFMS